MWPGRLSNVLYRPGRSCALTTGIRLRLLGALLLLLLLLLLQPPPLLLLIAGVPK
jgi:hypothetical protein